MSAVGSTPAYSGVIKRGSSACDVLSLLLSMNACFELVKRSPPPTTLDATQKHPQPVVYQYLVTAVATTHLLASLKNAIRIARARLGRRASVAFNIERTHASTIALVVRVRGDYTFRLDRARGG